MALTEDCPLAGILATRLVDSRDELTARWLDRIAARVSVDPNRIFPTAELLNHVPVLIDGIAAYVANPASIVSADMTVVDKARELGVLRHTQGFDQYQILKEFEILGGILLSFVGHVAGSSDVECTREELMACAQRVFHAVSLIQEATSTQFLQLVTDRVAEREERLRAFNRALTHEFRNRIGACLGAGQILQIPNLDEEKRGELAAVIVRNVRGMQGILDNLLELTMVGADARQHRHVRLPGAAAEVGRELREMAAAQGVTLRFGDSLPDVEVAAAAIELCLTNLVSNAIKYSDPAERDPWIEVRGALETLRDGEVEVVVEVADNGLGVPESERGRLFERFYRASHGEREIEGTGLGLSIVRETVKSLGGRVWARFPEKGSVFAFSLPCRRDDEARAVTGE
ncbi:MAG TPA: sensor histidine kinase [Gemmatimonadaceae bacterium]|nr:sensor histidine kinase [Gemmatimonadaceae bacterium]